MVGLSGPAAARWRRSVDVDVMFLTAAKRPPRRRGGRGDFTLLWDLKLKVGHSLRSIAELIALAKQYMTVRTRCSSRGFCGAKSHVRCRDAPLPQGSRVGHRRRVVAAKLAERDARHVRMGDSRYVVEPNVKDGKGGLRDLQRSMDRKYVHGVERPADLVGAGLLRRRSSRASARTSAFSGRCAANIHLAAGAAEDASASITTAHCPGDEYATAGQNRSRAFMQLYSSTPRRSAI